MGLSPWGANYVLRKHFLFYQPQQFDEFFEHFSLCTKNFKLLIYPLHGRNTKKLKTKTSDFFVNTHILVKLFQKSQNNNIVFYEKFQK